MSPPGGHQGQMGSRGHGLITGLVPWEEEAPESLLSGGSFSVCTHSEGAGWWWCPAASQEKSSTGPDHVDPDLTPSLGNCGKINFCCSSQKINFCCCYGSRSRDSFIVFQGVFYESSIQLNKRTHADLNKGFSLTNADTGINQICDWHFFDIE